MGFHHGSVVTLLLKTCEGLITRLKGFVRQKRALISLRDQFLGATTAVSLLVLSTVSPGVSATAAAGEKPLSFIALDCDSAVKGPKAKACWLVQSVGEWKWVANQYSGDQNGLTLPLQTDFTKHTIIVIDHGLATTAVHMSTEAVLKSDAGVIVENAIRIPGPGVSVEGQTHRLIQVIRCNKTTGPLIVRVRYQEYDSLGFIRDRVGPPPGREALLRPLESEQKPAPEQQSVPGK